MAENTVFLLLTALIRNFYKAIIQRLDVKRFGLNTTSRIKAFVFRFVSIPAKRIRTSNANAIIHSSFFIYSIIWGKDSENLRTSQI